jgi:hypothetical protein
MKLYDRLRTLTPSAIVLSALPVLFLALPDGLAMLYAVCATVGTGGAVNNPAINLQTDCRTDSNGIIYQITDAFYTTHFERCEMTAQVDLVINQEDQENCSISWMTYCGTQLCSISVAATGPTTATGLTRTVKCDQHEPMEIDIGNPSACPTCSPTTVLIVTGTCGNP